VDRAIALVVALGQERRALERSLRRAHRRRGGDLPLLTGACAGRRVVLVQAGIGQARARQSLLTVSDRFPVSAAWSVGFAGGLSVTIRAGDLVCPATVLQDDGGVGKPFGAASAQGRVLDALAAAGMPIHGGRLLSVDAPVRTPEAKQAAYRRTGAVAVDMEAAGVAEAAQVLGVPWLALKVVVDDAEQPLPSFLTGCTTAQGGIRWGPLIWSFLTSRERRESLFGLSRAAHRGADRLQCALEAALNAWSA